MQCTVSHQPLYQSIALNGVTSTLNKYYNPGSTPGWWGVTVSYQLDGNYEQSPYCVDLDKLTFRYREKAAALLTGRSRVLKQEIAIAAW